MSRKLSLATLALGALLLAVPVVAQQPDSVYGVWDLMSDENLGIAVKKDDFSTLQWLKSFLQSYVGGAEYKASVGKWFDRMDWMDSVTAE